MDYDSGSLGLSFTRHYNSFMDQDMGMGVGWSSPFHKHLEPQGGNNLIARQGSGRGESFNCANSPCTGLRDATLALTRDTSGYTLTHRDKSTERYDLNGKLLSETDPSGKTTTYSYDGSGRLWTVTGPFGHTLTVGYNTSNHVASITDPAGNVIAYSYHTYTYNGGTTASVVLTGVTYRDNIGTNIAGKIYHYDDSLYPNLMTGISYVDASGGVTRYSTYGYYYNSTNLADLNNGNAVLTQHAQTDNPSPQEKFTISYDSATQTTVTDPIGTQKVMTFATNYGLSTKNLVSRVNLSDNPSKPLQQTFDGNNNLTCRKDEENRVTLYSSNGTNQKLSMTEGLSGSNCNTCLSNPATCNTGGVGRVTTYDYLSPTLDLPRFIRRLSVASGQTFETELVYGDAGHPNLPTQVIQRGYTPTGTAVSRTFALGYNTYGQVNSINGPRSPSEPGMNGLDDVATLEYYACTTGGSCGQLKKVTNTLGHVTTYDLYDANGRLTQMTDPNGLRTGYTYDPRGRVKTITQTTPAGSAATWQYSYTAWGDVSQVIDPDGVVLNYQYDVAHYLRFIVDAANNYIHYTYDLKGNRIHDYTYDPSGVLTRTVGYSYDLRNHLASINLAGNITQVVYDAVGNLTSETDPNTHATTHTPDALNRLMQTIDRLGGITGYSYDLNDRLTRVTPPGKIGTQYAHDDLGNLLSETSPDRNTTLYTYDAAGNLKTVQTARGNVVGYSYDALNRLTFADAPVTANDTTYVYDTCANGIGRLCSVSNSWAAVTYGYSPRGKVNSHQSVNYGYGLAGRLRTLTYPSGAIVTYGYNNVGQVSQVSLTRNGITQVIASGIQYTPYGPVKALTYGNSKTLSQAWDVAYRLRSQTISGVVQLDYAQYDANGNLLQRNEAITSQASNFTYDVLDRLDTAAGSFGSRDYDHDANGNRTRLSEGATVTNYSYAPNTNRLTQAGATAVTVDADGNLTAQGSRTYAYNALDRLVQAYEGSTQIAGYTYNGLGQRVSKQAGNATTSFAYGLEGQLLVETSGTTAREYLYLNGQPLAVMDQAVATGSPTVTVTTVPALLGGSLNVTWSGIASPTAYDWIGVYVPGSNDFAYLDWNYTNGGNSGTVNVSLSHPSLVAGAAYEARLYANDGYTLLAKSAPFVVNPTGPVLAVTTAPAVRGQSLTTKWSGIASPTAYDWIGVYVPGSNDFAYLDWNYTNGGNSGSLAFPLNSYAVTAGGTYEMRLYANDGYTLLAKSPPFTLAAAGSSVPAALYYVHNDHLGTPQTMTNEAGAVVWRATYDPFGQATVTTQTIQNNVRLPGMYADSETGLYYVWHRYYDPKTGRWISSDPIGLTGGLNTYAYVANNPLRWIDPLGLWSPGGHDALYSNAFIGILDQSEIEIIQQESRALDRSTGVGVSTAYIHSMRKPFQSAQAAKAASKKYICDKLKQARGESSRTQALKDFADAAHTITDSFSPEHTDSNGNPRMWFPLLFSGLSPNDYVGSETVNDITPKIYEKATAALIDAYNQAFSGNSSNSDCGCQ